MAQTARNRWRYLVVCLAESAADDLEGKFAQQLLQSQGRKKAALVRHIGIRHPPGRGFQECLWSHRVYCGRWGQQGKIWKWQGAFPAVQIGLPAEQREGRRECDQEIYEADLQLSREGVRGVLESYIHDPEHVQDLTGDDVMLDHGVVKEGLRSDRPIFLHVQPSRRRVRPLTQRSSPRLLYCNRLCWDNRHQERNHSEVSGLAGRHDQCSQYGKA